MNNVIKTNWKEGKTTLYRHIHLFTLFYFFSIKQLHG